MEKTYAENTCPPRCSTAVYAVSEGFCLGLRCPARWRCLWAAVVVEASDTLISASAFTDIRPVLGDSV